MNKPLQFENFDSLYYILRMPKYIRINFLGHPSNSLGVMSDQSFQVQRMRKAQKALQLKLFSPFFRFSVFQSIFVPIFATIYSIAYEL